MIVIEDVDRLLGSDFLGLASVIATAGKVRGFVYLLCMDRHAVEHAVSSSGADGPGYLRKVISRSIRIPPGAESTLNREFNSRTGAVLQNYGLQFERRDLQRRVSTTHWLTVVPSLRHIKQLAGRFDAVVGQLQGEVNSLDLLHLTALDEFAPTVVPGVWRAQDDWLVNERIAMWTAKLDQKASDEEVARRAKVLDDVAPEQGPAIQAMLSSLFPRGANSLELLADQRVALREYLQRYIERRVAPEHLPDSLVSELLSVGIELSKVDKTQATNRLREAFEKVAGRGELHVLLQKWIAVVDRIDPPADAPIIAALSRAAKSMPETDRASEDDARDRARALIFSLIAKESSAERRSDLATIVIDSASSLEFAREFVEYSGREHNRILSDDNRLDVGALRRQLANRIRRELADGEDPFALDGPRRGAYVLSAIRDRDRSAQFVIDKGHVLDVLAAYSRIDRSGTGYVLEMAELCEGYNVRKLQEHLRSAPAGDSRLSDVLLEEAVPCREAELPIRLPSATEKGQPFDEYVRRVAKGQAPKALQFIQEWDHTRDDLGRPPTIGDMSEYWTRSVTEIREGFVAFQAAFPDEPDPGAIVDLLWDATARGGFQELTKVPIIAVRRKRSKSAPTSL